MKTTNLVIVYLLIVSIVTAFFFGGYHTLQPTLFLIGLAGVAIISTWRTREMDSKNLALIIILALIIAFIDEFAHTSSGLYTYFDHGIPSPLTVFGWGLFIIVIVTGAEFIKKLLSVTTTIPDRLRLLPFLLVVILIPILVVIQGYASLFSWWLILWYVIMGITSLYYVNKICIKWHIAIMVSSLVIGGSMEVIGALQGLWAFHFLEPLPLFMMLTWTLRTWTILSINFLLGVDFSTGD